LDLVKEKHFWFSEIGSKKFEAPLKIKKKIMNESVTRQLPLISIIIVTFNSGKFISECLDSILDSNYPKMEVIAVDNGSTDNSIDQLSKYKDKIKIISAGKNLGFASGNNLGIKESNGEIIILINPDVFVTKNSFRELVLPFLSDNKIMITGPKILYPHSSKIQSAGGMLYKNGLSRHIGYGEKDTNQYDFARTVDYVTGAAMAIRKKLFDITGLFDDIYFPAYFEEVEKCFLAKKLGYKVVYSPQSTVYHYESTTHSVDSKPYLKMYHSNRFKFIYKNFDLRSLLLNFLPYEIGWFFYFCPSSSKGLVVKAHLRTIFSPVVMKKRIMT